MTAKGNAMSTRLANVNPLCVCYRTYCSMVFCERLLHGGHRDDAVNAGQIGSLLAA